MSNKIIPKFCGAVTLVAGLAISAMPAQAGFQWVAPTDGGSYQQPPVVVSAAPAVMAPETISPVVISGDTQPASAAPTYLVPPAPASEKLSMASATIVVPAGGVVQGFASQVPLALALRQILPVGYSFSIDQNVGMDTLVSYKGGKPWRDTLDEMLAPAGLVEHVQGSTVTIDRAAATPASVATDTEVSKETTVVPLSESPVIQSAVAYAAPSAPPVVPSVNVTSVDGWSAERGETLHKVLTDWCHRSNVELQWLAEYDYPIGASVHFSDGFEDAVRGLLAGFDGARPQPIGELHTNTTAGQKVLVVQARGNNYTN